MIAKAKAISYGINDLRYITGESKHKKHPEKIYRVLDNLLPPELDAMGIWNSMQLTLAQHRPIKNSIIRIELSPSPEHTSFYDIEDWPKSSTNKRLPVRTGKSVLARPIWQTANTLFTCTWNPKGKSLISMPQFAALMKTGTSTMTITFIFGHNVQPSELQ